MYSVQLEKFSRFSLAEWSSEEPAWAFPAAGGMPQAASVLRPPAASAPPPAARSSDRRLNAPCPRGTPARTPRRIAANWAGVRRSGSYCSMRGGPFERGGHRERRGPAPVTAAVRIRGDTAVRGGCAGCLSRCAAYASYGARDLRKRGAPYGAGRSGQRRPKTVRCQSFRATAVLSYMTCLIWVYSSKE